jgi:hypothetical protein
MQLSKKDEIGKACSTSSGGGTWKKSIKLKIYTQLVAETLVSVVNIYKNGEKVILDYVEW